MELKKINTTALAYIGDAVYEVFVREKAVAVNPTNVDVLHKHSIKFVRAEGQALAVKRLFDDLTEEEQALVKRARNHKISSKPKNADPVVYKLATAFEALIGYLYLSGKKERLEEIMERAVEIIGNEAQTNVRKQGKA